MQQGDIDYEMIGSRIRERRQKAGLTQEQLAEKLDVVPEYISRIENGRAQINLKRLGEISALLNTPIEYFVAGSVYNGDAATQAISSAVAAMSPRQRKHLANIVQEIQWLALDS